MPEYGYAMANNDEERPAKRILLERNIVWQEVDLGAIADRV